MVPEEGLEPSHTHVRQILSLLRLPFRHSGKKHGAGEGNRTLVASLEGWSSAIELRPLTKNHPSYGMALVCDFHLMAGSTGLEPATPGSTVQCANQLRHDPAMGEKQGV